VQKLDSLPQDAPGWLTTRWQDGARGFQTFVPDKNLEEKISHVKDWIKGALHSDEPWVRDVDEKGRPKKLLQIGTLARAVAEADKAMKNLSTKFNAADEGEGALEVVREFDDGYVMARLLTPQALDRESGMMGHCIGGGGYDEKLIKGSIEIYSLRDSKNRAHATLAVRANNQVLQQCKGKKNKAPVTKYMPHVQTFIKERHYKLNEATSHTGLIEQDGVYYDIYNLPAGLSIDSNLDLMSVNITKLPDGLSVGKDINLYDTPITDLPDGLNVGGDINLYGTPITDLPDGLSVDGDLDLYRTSITKLPEDLEVSDTITMPDGACFEDVGEARVYLAHKFPQQNEKIASGFSP